MLLYPRVVDQVIQLLWAAPSLMRLPTRSRTAATGRSLWRPVGLRLRIARAGDRGAVRAFLDRLSPGTVQARYLSSYASRPGLLGDGELNRILDRKEAEHFVVLAVDGTEIRGIGEFVNERVDRADVALVVEDDFQGRGIGRLLFRKLEQIALERGIRAFTGDMAYGNSRAVALLRGTGQTLQTQVGYGSLHFTLLLES